MPWLKLYHIYAKLDLINGTGSLSKDTVKRTEFDCARGNHNNSDSAKSKAACKGADKDSGEGYHFDNKSNTAIN